MTRFSILILANCIHCVYQDVIKSSAVVGKKNCADYGKSVGTLHWVVDFNQGRLVAECRLENRVPNLNYSIYWTNAREDESEKIVKECTQTLQHRNDKILSCSYSPLMIEDGHMVCFVKSIKGSNFRTRCSSDEIQIDGLLGRAIQKPENIRQSDTSNLPSTPVQVYTATIKHADTVSDENLIIPLEVYSNSLDVIPIQKTSSRAMRTRPKLRTLDIEATSNTIVLIDTTEYSVTNTDFADDFELVPTIIDPFTISDNNSDIKSSSVQIVFREDDMPMPLYEQPTTSISTELPVILKREPKPDTWPIEGWKLRIGFLALAVLAVLVAGNAIGSALAVKFHNRGTPCCESECCQPCGAMRID